MKCAAIVSAAITVLMTIGCAGRPSLLPNSDPSLRRTSAQFAADAAKRHPFKSNAPSGGEAKVSAQYNLTFATVELLNYGNEDLDDVEVWVNRNWCCWIPKLEKGKVRVKTLPFQMLYDDSGNYFWTDNGKTPITTIDLFYGGKMFTVPFKMAD
ncbi:MAG TPA: hypothetical protein VG326_13715 [Tepidisphaeraceae bacterium]|nr:hypothetical protein [Tepidisphaeraceae bacterium]